MVKIYGMPGKTSAIINIPINSGKATLTVEFTRGCTDVKNYRPATYRSDNSIEQSIIENSPEYGRTVVLLKTIGEPEKPVVKKPAESASDEMPEPVSDEAMTMKEYPEVTSFEAAVSVLKAIPGVKAVQLKTPDLAHKLAISKGVSFPNYSFE